METGRSKKNNNPGIIEGNEKDLGFFSVISDFLDCLVVILDQQGKIVYYNQFCEKITGYSFDEVRDKCYWEIFCLPEEKELYKAFFKMLEVDQYPLEIETQVKDKHEKTATILWKYNALQPNNGDKLYHVLSGTDITNYDRANKELQKIGEKYRTIIHVSPVSVISLTTDFRIKSWSSAAEKLLGWTEKEVLDQSIFFVLGNSDSFFENSCLDTVYGKTTCDLELSCAKKDGTPLCLNLYMAPMRDFSGVVEGIVIIALDITERKKAENLLNFQVQVEKLIANVSSYFASLPAEHLNDGINDVLDMVGRFLQVDRGCVIKISADGKLSNISHKWSADGIKPVNEEGKLQDLNQLAWLREKLHFKSCISISDVEKLPPEAEKEKNELKAQMIKSLICVPLFKEGELFGVVGFDTVTGEKAWNNEHKKLLVVIAELIASAFFRYLAHLEISYMSFHDQLTGLYNRHFLAEEMKRLDTARQLPLSIIMADLNGLKLVNDIYGHIKGDELLKQAASILGHSCREEDIIARWGGDEFIVLLPNTSLQKANTIKKRIQENCSGNYAGDLPVSIALGAACKWKKDDDLQMILKKAEDNMYSQKLAQSRSTSNAVLSALVNTLADKSFETEEHIRKLQEITGKIAGALELSEIELNRLELLVSLHDIGKINISKDVLTKSSPLTEAEWESIKRHPETGFRFVRATDEFGQVAEEILAHHENYDGSGYPRGLKGMEIPLLSRILTVADACEVMESGRPYRRKMNKEEIVAEFKRCSGSQFDPELVKILLAVLAEEE